MKVALYHDWLTGFRGGERVLEAFCELFPDAPIYTLIHQEGVSSSVIDQKMIYTSKLNKIPNIQNNYRKFLPAFPHVIKSFKLKDDYDLILSSSHCVIKGIEKPAGATHISYIHSPMRYMYDQFDNYFGKNAPRYQQLGAKLFRRYLTSWDINSNKNVDHMIANSNFVQSRITKYYQRDSSVIHPFVDLEDFKEFEKIPPHKSDYFIILSAFAPNKKVELAIRAFNKNGKKLKIIGSGQQENYLREIAKNNIEFLGNLERSEVIKYLSQAQALIFPGVEDFGIVPLESMAAGTPVIAFKAGGVLETLTNKVCEFFDESTVESLNSGIENFNLKNFSHNELRHQSEKFSRDIFKRKIMDEIKFKMGGSLG